MLYFGKLCFAQCQNIFVYIFFWEFYSFNFILRPRIHFKLIFYVWCEEEFWLHFTAVTLENCMSHISLLQRTNLFLLKFWANLLKFNWVYLWEFISGLSVLLHWTMHILTLVLQNLDYYNFVLHFEPDNVSSSTFSFKDYFNYYAPLVFCEF
jgi:hypothetical protein